MGKWNRRYTSQPRRRYYQDYQWSPPRDEPCPDPETEDWQDNVPMWEKKFCYLVGRMPWRKVLSTKNFMHCQSNVHTWDDSAGEESFLNAKKRFWDEINGLPCESQLPDPNMYIDDAIDWNPYIDPELVKELDKEYFNPDDKYYLPSAHSSNVNNGWPDTEESTANQNKATGCNKWNHKPIDDNNGQESDNVKSNNNWQDDSDNNLDSSALKDGATGWNQWDNSVNDRYKSSKDDDPWEIHCPKDNAVDKNNSWAGAWNKSWDSTPQNQSNSWRNEGKRWQDPGPSSRDWNQNKADYNKPNFPNNNYRPREYGPHNGNRGSHGKGNTWGKKQWDNSNWELKDCSNNFRGRGRGNFNAGCRKRGPDHYAMNHKGPRLHEADSQSTRFWNEDNDTRVGFGGQWS